ncbi:MAG: tRNA (adenosine(37)-N6)-threonylcarbamoyltransferase complex transferase subunit TsaD [Phycisphaerales bacterium]|nr:tRNA (adenosine(37)-N6)-threonylcarbamoyltransferase complex transferase subunit TsaD [Phycisphaerales bacterium]
MTARVILGIESSCDETSAALVRVAGESLQVLACNTASQDELHAEYRGVVPEIASRAHLDRIIPVVRSACAEARVSLQQLAGVAVGHRPGLIGSLLVGVSAAKSLAWGLNVPFVGVDHVLAHLIAGLLDHPPLVWPAIGLVASGGHTSLFRMQSPLDIALIGATIDDAAGEAFDKGAAILGIGYPGGASLDAVAEAGDAARIPLPITRLPSLDFSFSGVKTALALAAKNPEHAHRTADLAASFRRVIIAQVLRNLGRALDEYPAATVLVGGGVAANRLLRRDAAALCLERGVALRIADPRWCTDNAAMIAGAGALRIDRGECDGWDMTAQPLSALARGRRGPQARIQ